jgi:adenylate kinase
VPQAEALDHLLAEHGLGLDAVIALGVDEGRLLQRIEKRVADMAARGEALRADDNAEVLKGRLAAYRAQTAPVIQYYASKGMLRRVDGMAPIEAVGAAIDGVLVPGAAKTASLPAARAKSAKPAKSAGRGAQQRKRTKRSKSAKAAARTKVKRRKKATPKAAPRRRGATSRRSARSKNSLGKRKSGGRRRLTKAR